MAPTENSTRTLQGIFNLSEVGAGLPQKKRRDLRRISRALQSFPTLAALVPESLHQPTPKAISLAELATRLNVEPQRLLPAIEHGYIRLVIADPPTVFEPPPAAMNWLASMYTALPMRPLVTTDMVAVIEGIEPADVRSLCLSYDIPVYSDPVFGELLSLAAFYKLHAQLHNHRTPSRFDRQALLVAFLQAADPTRYKHVIKPPKFSRRIENEVVRISRLPEPARTDAALRLYDSLSAAKAVADSITAAHGVEPAKVKGVAKVAAMVLATENPPD